MAYQRFRFAVNGKLFSSVAVKRGESFVCEMVLPRNTITDGFLGIEVYCGDAVAPALVRKSMDARALGFEFSYAKVEVAE